MSHRNSNPLQRVGTVLVVFAAVVLSACSHHQAPSSSAPLKFERRAIVAPELSDEHGGRTSLSRFSGRVVMLHFWASWCFMCVGELTQFQRLEDKFSEELAVVAVGVRDEPTRLTSTLEKTGVRLRQFLDPEGALLASFGAEQLPATVVLDKQGSLVKFPDPATQQPVWVVQGPRNWSGTSARQTLEILLAE